MSLILIGYRGCGKTTVGRKLADRLWWKFVDTDELVMQAENQTIAELFASGGEQRFRDAEERAVANACSRVDHVIALGGGAVLRESNRDAIRNSGHRCIYLRCEPPELLRRIEDDPLTSQNRPNLSARGGISEVESLLAVREPLYREIAHAEVDVTNLSIDEAVIYVARLA